MRLDAECDPGIYFEHAGCSFCVDPVCKCKSRNLLVTRAVLSMIWSCRKVRVYMAGGLGTRCMNMQRVHYLLERKSMTRH